MQLFEQAFFAKKQPNWQGLIDFGFRLQGGQYVYCENFMNNQFQAIVCIDKNGVLTGKVWDLELQVEYINFRLPQQVGAFVGEVRETYGAILQKIARQCFQTAYAPQTGRIMKSLPQPDYPFKKYPDFAVYRSPSNQKWYGLLMPISYQQLDFRWQTPNISDYTQKVDILNIKVDPQIMPDCFHQAGVYPSYHMNKKHWLTLTLDDQLSDEQILQWLAQSRRLVE